MFSLFHQLKKEINSTFTKNRRENLHIYALLAPRFLTRKKKRKKRNHYIPNYITRDNIFTNQYFRNERIIDKKSIKIKKKKMNARKFSIRVDLSAFSFFFLLKFCFYFRTLETFFNSVVFDLHEKKNPVLMSKNSGYITRLF